MMMKELTINNPVSTANIMLTSWATLGKLFNFSLYLSYLYKEVKGLCILSRADSMHGSGSYILKNPINVYKRLVLIQED